MNRYDDWWVKTIAEYTIRHRSTVRATAQHFNIPKSSVHQILTESLPLIHRGLHQEVQEVLKENLAARAERGGKATQKRWAYIKTVRAAPKHCTPKN